MPGVSDGECNTSKVVLPFSLLFFLNTAFICDFLNYFFFYIYYRTRKSKYTEYTSLDYTFFETCSIVYVDVFKTCNNEYITYSKMVRISYHTVQLETSRFHGSVVTPRRVPAENGSVVWRRGDAHAEVLNRFERRCRCSRKSLVYFLLYFAF